MFEGILANYKIYQIFFLLEIDIFIEKHNFTIIKVI